jgi:hypothetical protein
VTWGRGVEEEEKIGGLRFLVPPESCDLTLQASVLSSSRRLGEDPFLGLLMA